MSRIKIDDLPPDDKNLTPEELADIEGAGRPSFRPTIETLEGREMYAANLASVAPPALQGHALVQQTPLVNVIQLLSTSNTAAPPAQGAGHAAPSPALDQALAGFVPGPLLRTGRVNPLLAPTQKEADAYLQTNYEQWKTDFLRDGGNGTLRVARPDGANAYLGIKEDTVSEGQAYGMLLAVYHNDRTTFDKLWAFAKSRFNENGNGLMPWHIGPDGHTIDAHAATDADQDMAMALIVADKNWGGYKEDAKTLIGNIMEHEVEKGTNVLKPGDVFGGSDQTNPSYFAPAYYKVFQTYTGDPRWKDVTDKAYEILNKAANPTTGLVPQWVKADGTALPGDQYAYDAMRTPWRIALDAVWNEDPRAIAYLNKVNAFFKSVGVKGVWDKYSLDGRPLNEGYDGHNVAGVSMAATAAIVDPDAAYRHSFWNEIVSFKHETDYNKLSYYNDSLRALSVLLVSGRMTKP